jgi:tRNA G18 (ribose-2'-O)-methylase SpoU
LIHVASNSEEWQSVHERETIEDERLYEEFRRRHKAWDDIDPQLVAQATNVLKPYLKPERVQRIHEVLNRRTTQTRFLFENPANPSNVWACLRTLDSYGIQHVDVVIQSGKYAGKAALSQKRGMRTAMGSAKWLTLKNHLTTRSALQTMKEEGYHILYTDVNPSSKDIRDVDWDKSGKPICIVMGNEQRGVSDVVREYADESFYLPMYGFAESFSLSVATASLCAYLLCASAPSQPQRQEDDDDDANDHDRADNDRPQVRYTGPLRPGNLSEKEYNTLFLRGCLNSMNGKTGKALLNKNGLVFPPELNLS